MTPRELARAKNALMQRSLQAEKEGKPWAAIKLAAESGGLAAPLPAPEVAPAADAEAAAAAVAEAEAKAEAAAKVCFLLCTVIFYANLAHSLTRSP